MDLLHAYMSFHMPMLVDPGLEDAGSKLYNQWFLFICLFIYILQKKKNQLSNCFVFIQPCVKHFREKFRLNEGVNIIDCQQLCSK